MRPIPEQFSDSPISDATRRNWRKLETDVAADGKLTSRANKRRSTKRIFPVERVADPKNVPIFRRIVDFCLDGGISPADAVFSCALGLARRAKLDGTRRFVDVLDAAPAGAAVSFRIVPELVRAPLPGADSEPDALGTVYQSLLPEGVKNELGSYFTPVSLVAKTTRETTFSNGETFFDPCCGSGAFFARLRGATPERLFGIDADPIAAALAKINLILQFPNVDFVPNIVWRDYLASDDSTGAAIFGTRFDFIATNPPWGAATSRKATLRKPAGTAEVAGTEIASGETFARFFVRAVGDLRENGVARFLLPESVLNVKAHRDLREFLLTRGRLESINVRSERFSGVATGCVDVEFRRAAPRPGSTVVVRRDGERAFRVPTSRFWETNDFAFQLDRAPIFRLLRKIRAAGRWSLRESRWALGIVTGNNKKTLKDAPADGCEPIFAGKDVAPLVLAPPRRFIRFDRRRLQQAAKDEFYRAPKKLVYRFVATEPVVAVDSSGALCLNSANVLIPDLPGYSIETVAAFLNSAVVRFYYVRTFGGVKVLKGNLCALPFPEIDAARDRRVAALVAEIADESDSGVATSERFAALDAEVAAAFRLTKRELATIRAEVGNGDRRTFDNRR